ncbi:MAG: hypothetical protein ACF8Q5_08460, partial [Phycisphaerales bacterium JB040]
MNLSQFFQHWGIAENPFRGEEARHDEVFARMERTAAAGGMGSAMAGRGHDGASRHSDFEKIAGELTRCSTSVVFGEKGSGKTAIRLQLADAVHKHNQKAEKDRILLVSYDELNRFLDQLYARHAGGSKPADVGDVLAKTRLVDHMDAILSLATTRLIGGLLAGVPDAAPLGPEPWKTARALSHAQKRDLLALQAVYDAADRDGRRTGQLRRRLRIGGLRGAWLWTLLTWLGWIPAAAALYWVLTGFGQEPAGWLYTGAQGLTIALAAAYLGVLLKTQLVSRLIARRWGRRLHRQLRVLARPAEAYEIG